MTNRNVTVHYIQDSHAEGQKVRVGSDGRGRFLVPPGRDSFVLQEGPRDGKEPNRIAFTDCRLEANAVLAVQDVVKEGKAFHNSCGKAERAAKPGEIIFWGKPIPWWTPDFQ